MLFDVGCYGIGYFSLLGCAGEDVSTEYGGNKPLLPKWFATYPWYAERGSSDMPGGIIGSTVRLDLILNREGVYETDKVW